MSTNDDDRNERVQRPLLRSCDQRESPVDDRGTWTPVQRRAVIVGGAAALTTLLPKPGYALFSSEGDSPTSVAGGADSTPQPLEGKTALVTGATEGLGKAVALMLANMGARVLIHGRDEQRGAALVATIRHQTPGCAKFYNADLASLTAVRTLACAVRKDCDCINLLINNAGIGVANGDGSRTRKVSADGIELRFAVNYLSSYLLTRELLPTLIRNAPARIVNVASLSQRPLEFDNVMLERDYDGGRAYGQSKLAQIMFTQDLAEELAGKNVTVNAVHPATNMDMEMVDTQTVRVAGAQPRSTVEEGADAVVHLATAIELGGKSGLFFNGKREMRANAMAYNASSRRQLRELSERLTSV